MMRPLGILVLAAVGVGRAPAALVPRTVEVGGIERHYLLAVPASYDGTRPYPLVLVFHGAGYGGAAMEHDHPLDALGERKGFISVFPDGLGNRWNGGRTYDPFSGNDKSDDVVFVSKMIEALEAGYKIDRRRIFATGSSNGAIFCYTLAARLSAQIAAIAPVSGSVGEEVPRRFHPDGPVSVVSFNGTADPMVPFAGYSDPGGHGQLSVADSLSLWVAIDGCAGEPQITKDPPSPLDDGTRVIRLFYPKLKTGCEVLAFIVGGGGHTWPGTRTDPTWAKTAGKTAMSINASEIMWDFFERHPKPQGAGARP